MVRVTCEEIQEDETRPGLDVDLIALSLLYHTYSICSFSDERVSQRVSLGNICSGAFRSRFEISKKITSYNTEPNMIEKYILYS